MTDYAALEAAVIGWLQPRQDVRLAVVVGSRAILPGQPSYRADAASDLDVVAFTTDPARYVPDGAWLAQFGEVWVAHLDMNSGPYPEWLVVYAGGLDFDIMFVPAPPDFGPAHVLAEFSNRTRARGFRVLIDRDGILPRLPEPALLPPDPPTAAAFETLVTGFWRYAERTAKKLQRGELWTAQRLGWNILKTGMLRLVEWGALVQRAEVDTWYGGRFVERWGDAQFVAALPDLLPRYAAAEQWRALLATLAQFDRLARDVAAFYGFTYPTPGILALHEWLRGQAPAGDDQPPGDS
ncbi:MAG: aminoglycoside 6-adenylyltransferase [Anaerolineae bacterium]|nr:aminoglycoside 6-adenylyltransferase [Anaerolineae bacterium]